MTDALRLWVVLARAYAAIEARATAHVARHGLTLAEFGILEALYHKGPLQPGEVKGKILVSSGGVTYLVDRLEAQRLVRRRPCPGDRRARLLELTGKGRRFIRKVFAEHSEMLEDALSGLERGEQKRAASLLKKLGRHAAGLEETLED